MASTQIASDQHCVLGKWLHGGGREYQTDPHYVELLDLHARFHGCAAKVVHAAQQGGNANAQQLLAPGSEYERTVRALTWSLNALKKVVEAA